MAHRTIAQKADIIATLRHLHVYLMESLARWTPTTPQLEVKILFGRHLWECAQHADVLGHRTSELRAGLHYTRPPVAAHKAILEEIAAFENPTDRVAGIYDAIIPDLIQRYDALLRDADPLLDQPSIRLWSRIHSDLQRLRVERDELMDGAVIEPAAAGWADRLKSRLAAQADFTDYRPLVKEAATA
jgi:hypothetical protein